ncbi:MAG TPA: SDR family oxidoreductase [Baekduia sp.]|nr:SDR family oxidoreductase [Baekduia sp.]
MTTLITGATGFVGGEVLVRLLEQTGDDVVALVRAEDDERAQARIDAALDHLLPPGTVPARRVRAVAADLERPHLGLTPRRCLRLAAELDAVIHCAASIEFTLPLERATAINVDGTRELLRLAGCAPGLRRFVHVSTAFVAGDRAGRFLETEGDVGQTCRNTYEQTKLAAEQEVLAAGLPGTVIARPSIVVGDSATGWTSAFNVIYWPLQAFARGLFPTVPADPGAPVDIVPVDAVADALLDLLGGDERGAVHVVAGDDAPTLGALARLASAAFGRPEPAFVGPGEAPEAERLAGPLLPYLRVRGTFDGGRRHAAGLEPPPLTDYFGALVAYADEARWGKRPQRRWERLHRLQRAAA